MAFDFARYLTLPPMELRARLLGTIAIMEVLVNRNLCAAAARANSAMRAMLHKRPRPGRYIYRGRKKLAVNLRLKDIPDLPTRGAIAVDFKRASARRIDL